MTRLAILRPTTLVGKELQETLERRHELWSELRLLTPREEEEGTLSAIRGAAAIVGKATPESLQEVDLAFFCGPIEDHRALLGQLPSCCGAVILSPDATVDDGRPVVAGVNLEDAVGESRTLSPHPAVILVAHLLAPLRRWDPREVVGTVIEPISMHGREALDEVLEQTRNLLTFQPQSESTIFESQVAFNLFPSTTPSNALGRLVPRVLGLEELPVELGAVQGGVLHSLSMDLLVRFQEDPSAELALAAFQDHPGIEVADRPEQLGPIDAAGRDEILVGPVRPTPDGLRIWAVMDNLTVGGARNALAVAERMLAAGLAS